MPSALEYLKTQRAAAQPATPQEPPAPKGVLNYLEQQRIPKPPPPKKPSIIERVGEFLGKADKLQDNYLGLDAPERPRATPDYTKRREVIQKVREFPGKIVEGAKALPGKVVEFTKQRGVEQAQFHKALQDPNPAVRDRAWKDATAILDPETPQGKQFINIVSYATPATSLFMGASNVRDAYKRGGATEAIQTAKEQAFWRIALPVAIRKLGVPLVRKGWDKLTTKQMVTKLSPQQVKDLANRVQKAETRSLEFEKLTGPERAQVVKDAMKGSGWEVKRTVPRFGKAPPVSVARPPRGAPPPPVPKAPIVEQPGVLVKAPAVKLPTTPQAIALKPPEIPKAALPFGQNVTQLPAKTPAIIPPPKVGGELTKGPPVKEDLSPAEKLVLGEEGELNVEALTKELQKKVVPYLDVEKPFRDAGAPETGFAIKTMPSKMAIGEEKAFDFVDKVNKLNLKPEELRNLAFMGENTLPISSPKADTAVKMIRDELDSDLELLKKRGVLKDAFPESMIRRLEDRIYEIRGKKPMIKAKGALTRKGENVWQLEEQIKQLKKIKYMPIQLKILLEDVMNGRLAKGESLQGMPGASEGSMASFKKIMGRKSISLKELVDEGIVPKEKVDARELIATYKRFIHNKLAEKDIIDQAIKDKLFVPVEANPPENFVKIPGRYLPGYGDYMAHPVFADYLANMFQAIHGRAGLVAKAASITKMMQFYNPLFLPMNDMVQAAMLGSLKIHKFPVEIARSYKMMTERPPEYYEALEAGLASTPHKNPWQVFRKDLARMTTDKPNSFEAKVFNNLKRYGRTAGVDVLKDLYSLSWNVAWKLDRGVRFISYNYLRDKGYSVKDAAQTAASFHGDYAGVPASTRRQLNKVLFTPTFKIAMGKLYGSMAQGAVKYAGGASDPKPRAFGRGLLFTAAFILGRRYLLQKMGFKEEEFNRKYSLRVETPQGKRKINMTFADPTNIPFRYYYRFFKKRPEDLNVYARFAQGMKYELNPLWRIPVSLASNRKYGGGQVFKPFDPPEKQIADIAKFALEESVGIIKPFTRRKTKREKELRAAIQASSYSMFLNAMKVYSFQYGSDMDFVRNAKAAQRLTREYYYNERRYAVEGTSGGEKEFADRLGTFQGRLQQLLQKKDKQ